MCSYVVHENSLNDVKNEENKGFLMNNYQGNLRKNWDFFFTQAGKHHEDALEWSFIEVLIKKKVNYHYCYKLQTTS